jgi:rhodanese-related sulfurtransferase
MQQLAATQLASLLQQADPAPILVDVREPWEFALCHIAGSVHIPLSDLPARLTELDPSRAITLICHHGVRSEMAAGFLERHGFSDVANLTGGIAAWADQIEPDMARY